MPEIRSTLNFEQDGSPLPDMPAVFRQIYPESTGVVTIAATADSNTTSYHAVNLNITTISWLYLTCDQTLNLKFNGGSDVFALDAAGALLFAGISFSTSTLVEYNNPSSTTTANITIAIYGNS